MYNYHHLIAFIVFTFTRVTNLAAIDRISINCGSSAASSTSFSGIGWLGDSVFSNFSIKGSSTSSTTSGDPKVAVDPVPYSTARISRSQFTYRFRLGSAGQKLIRLHFNPTDSYNGFQTLDDFFNVEAGPFTLLANFSPSVTARALALNTVAKEFCLIAALENQFLDIIFSPSSSQQRNTYAFINGLEIISLQSTIYHCHSEDIGVRVVGQKSVVHIDHATALETILRLNIRWDSVLSGDEKANNVIINTSNNNNITWRISVDVGFRYLVRLHFSELGIKMVETGGKDFILLINHIIAITAADILRGNEGILWCKNYVVMMQGHKREGKRDILISLTSEDEIMEGRIPLEGFEIFKLSNHDNSLASPNPLPSTRDISFQTTNITILSFLGSRNSIATVVIVLACLVNIIVHMLRKNWGDQFIEDELKLSTNGKRLCRHFSLDEIRAATLNFNDVFVIGKGGFGKVYKGLIDNEQETVAIKRLKSDSKQGEREFWTEIEILSELRHVNLVSLIGYCNKQQEMILVYEYMPRGTLADHLYKLARKNKTFSSLSWKQRLSICIGAGRGLDYLHTGHEIIHRDVKTSNILLDEKFVAKVSDFGLAKAESGQLASINLKGTFGYFDPDYFRTRILTTKSDVYSFGVVLLEVLCGRPAVEPWVQEDSRSLTMWARDKISKGEVDQIVDQSLMGEISPDSLKAFARIAERCLHDVPKKRPAIANVVIRLEFALKQQENAESLVPNEITSIADFFPSNGKTHKEKAASFITYEISNPDLLPQEENCIENEGPSQGLAKSLVSNEIANVSDKIQQEKEESSFPDAITVVSNALPRSDKTSFSMKETYSRKITRGIKDVRKGAKKKLSRLLPWNAFSKTSKSSKRIGMRSDIFVSLSAPLARRTSDMALVGSTAFEKRRGGSNELKSTSNLRTFSFSELKAATRNFRPDTVLGEGGFGKVYKGWIYENSNAKNGSGFAVAVKKLNHQSMQGFEEWQSEVNFLGKLAHPNLVKLLGYCWDDNELLLVYEFMQKGSLEIHFFTSGSAIVPLPWDIRLNILIGAARGLAFLHSLNPPVIYRDFKPSNILLDQSFNAKLSDFGLAKSGPADNHTHVSTTVMGTIGYTAPEYIQTGHLYVKSDVYGFGVILVEMLTGLRAVDRRRPREQQNLVVWIKPNLRTMNKLKSVMDPRFEGRYPLKSALKIAQLALNCIELNPKSRPSMQEIVEALEKIDSDVVEKSRNPKVQFS